jgi:hypothetical protein
MAMPVKPRRRVGSGFPDFCGVDTDVGTAMWWEPDDDGRIEEEEPDGERAQR